MKEIYLNVESICYYRDNPEEKEKHKHSKVLLVVLELLGWNLYFVLSRVIVLSYWHFNIYDTILIVIYSIIIYLILILSILMLNDIGFIRVNKLNFKPVFILNKKGLFTNLVIVGYAWDKCYIYTLFDEKFYENKILYNSIKKYLGKDVEVWFKDLFLFKDKYVEPNRDEDLLQLEQYFIVLKETKDNLESIFTKEEYYYLREIYGYDKYFNSLIIILASLKDVAKAHRGTDFFKNLSKVNLIYQDTILKYLKSSEILSEYELMNQDEREEFERIIERLKQDLENYINDILMELSQNPEINSKKKDINRKLEYLKQ